MRRSSASDLEVPLPDANPETGASLAEQHAGEFLGFGLVGVVVTCLHPARDVPVAAIDA
jgi:hypothetical protein